MKPAPFRYERPRSLTEALTVAGAEPEAKVLAGGQSLIPLMSMRLSTVPVLIDINGLADLAHITVDETGVRFGAIVRHSDLLEHRGAREVQPLIAAALVHVAHPTIRNRGTTVGSIVHADASGEMPMILCLTGGSLTVASTQGRREIAATDLFVGPLETSLEAGEIAVEAFMPALAAGSGIAYDEIARRHGDYALCGVGAVVTLDEQGAITHARTGYVSVSEKPVVVDVTECFDEGQVDERSLTAAGELALGQLEPETDIHGTSDYRAQLARSLTARVLRTAHEDARARVAQKVRA